MMSIKFLLLVILAIGLANARSVREEIPLEENLSQSSKSEPFQGTLDDEMPPIIEQETKQDDIDDELGDLSEEEDEEIKIPSTEQRTKLADKAGSLKDLLKSSLKSAIAADAINDFTVDMLKLALSKNEGENVILSPYSIHTALQMLAAGANTVSKTELEEALRIKISDLDFFNDLESEMESEADEVRLDIANKVFVDKEVRLLESYQETLTNTMDSEVGVEDFRNKPEKSREKVNQWVEENTEEMIQDLFPSGSLDSTTQLVIANAVFYKGLWKEPFDAKNTEERDFQLENGTTVLCDMMWKNSKFPVFSDEKLNMKVVRIPYAGDEYDFVAAIPDSWPRQILLSERENEITSDIVKGWLEGLKKRADGYVPSVDVSLPKFKVELDMNLKEYLPELNIKSIFTQGADLSGITGSRNLYVGSARHKAFIEVNEAGTKAAAATGYGVMFMSLPMPIELNRPFLYFVVHRQTNTILFSGRMSDPSA